MSKELDWGKKKLQEQITYEITELFTNVLDYTQIAVGNKERYNALRSKILRAGNEAIRNLHKAVSDDYDVKYLNVNEDVIKVKQG